MASPRVGTQEAWAAARAELLVREAESARLFPATRARRDQGCWHRDVCAEVNAGLSADWRTPTILRDERDSIPAVSY